MTQTITERPDVAAVHPVDEVLPAPRLLILGLQHLFIMYAGAVAVPLIVGTTSPCWSAATSWCPASPR